MGGLVTGFDSNAFFYGLPLMSQHIVIYDTLLKQSTVEEVEAVLGGSFLLIGFAEARS